MLSFDFFELLCVPQHSDHSFQYLFLMLCMIRPFFLSLPNCYPTMLTIYESNLFRFFSDRYKILAEHLKA